jgi:tetratricopeptide (TPR) repeat protein
VAAEDEDRMKQLLVEAEGHARDAVVGHDDNVGRRFALAAVLGMRADREGGRTKVRAAAALHEELQVVLELDPDHAQAHYMMGRLHAGVRRMNGITRWLATNLLGGATLKQASWEEAERHLSFAEDRAPEVPDHHLQLARVYRDTGRPELALPELDHVLDMQVTSPMEREARGEALQIQAEIYEAFSSS